MTPNIERATLSDWYFSTFCEGMTPGFALMNPRGLDAKYISKTAALTHEIIYGALNGQTRRLPIDGKWQSVPISLAITPQNGDDRALARHIILDVDDGGIEAVQAILDVCLVHKLSAFAQLSQSDDHDGGHVWIVCEGWLPAALLRDIAHRLAHACGLGAEVYPRQQDIRLPLMSHLRAFGGVKRFPILLMTGEQFDVCDVWEAVELLKIRTKRATTEAIMRAHERLPALPKVKTRLMRKSEVTPEKKDSVIAWFLDLMSVRLMLEGAGVEFKSDTQKTCHCPFHDDKSPSMAIFRLNDGTDKEVCKCFAASCPTVNAPYLDAFDVTCLIKRFTPSEMVKEIVTLQGLGLKTTTIVRTITKPVTPADAMADHTALIARKRAELVNELEQARERRGTITVVNCPPGLGKSHAGAALALQAHAQYKNVSIVAVNLDTAQSEWETRLNGRGFVWRSKEELCTCHDPAYIRACLAHGYKVPACKEDVPCPYKEQAAAAHGKIKIFQHAHLSIRDGQKFVGDDLVIIDESPMNSLLSDRSVTYSTLEGFIKRNADDPANLLLSALAATMHELPEKINDVRGDELRAVIEKHLNGVRRADALTQARRSPHNHSQPQPPSDAGKMTQQFLHGLLKVLSDAPSTISYGRLPDRKQWALCWVEHKFLAKACQGLLNPPAIVILDGSSDQVVYDRLLSPWPVHFVNITAPLSPLVQVIQCPITGSTRSILREERKIRNLARQVAQVANHHRFEVVFDGGVCFAGAKEIFAETLGGEWLHFGGQRGKNTLEGARNLAVVCSPTIPPSAIERKALALWPDLQAGWEKTDVTAAWTGTDERLDALNKLHTLEELRQSVYRARPLTSQQETKLFVFSPWDLASIGLEPHHIVKQIANGHGEEAQLAVELYQNRARSIEQPAKQEAGRGGLTMESPSANQNVPAIFLPNRQGYKAYVAPPLVESAKILQACDSDRQLVMDLEGPMVAGVNNISPPPPACLASCSVEPAT